MSQLDGQTDKAAGRSMTRLALWIALAQFFLLASWTVYAVYLPALLVQVGVEKQFAPWILLADQVLFLLFDIAAGFAADRAFRAYARIGPSLLTATAVSSLAFLLMPWLPLWGGVTSGWRASLFIGLTVIWVSASAALRAPVFGLLSRHAAKAEAPGLAGLALFGLAVAAAISPYLGNTLKGLDPRLPFALASIALVCTAAMLIVAERRYVPDKGPADQAPALTLPATGLLALVLLAALGFQWGVNLNAAPRYLRDFPAPMLPWLLPVFWTGFSCSVFSAGKLCQRYGAAEIFAFGCLSAAGGLLLTTFPGRVPALLGYAISGLAWGAALAASFGLAAETGRPLRVATMTGLLFATLAAAAFARIAIGLAGWPWPQQPALLPWLEQVPALAWLASGLLCLALLRRVKVSHR